MSPLQQYEKAVRGAAICGNMREVGRCDKCTPRLARARRRIILSGIAYAVVASVAVSILWALALLLVAAHDAVNP